MYVVQIEYIDLTISGVRLDCEASKNIEITYVPGNGADYDGVVMS